MSFTPWPFYPQIRLKVKLRGELKMNNSEVGVVVFEVLGDTGNRVRAVFLLQANGWTYGRPLKQVAGYTNKLPISDKFIFNLRYLNTSAITRLTSVSWFPVRSLYRPILIHIFLTLPLQCDAERLLTASI